MSSIRLRLVDGAFTLIQTIDTDLPWYRNLDEALERRKLPAGAVVSGDDRPVEGGSITNLEQVALVDITILVADGPGREAAADAIEVAIHQMLATTLSIDGIACNWQRVFAGWQFEMGVFAARNLRYQVSYSSASDDLEVS